MSATLHCARLLGDDELREHLESRHTLIFEGLGQDWQEIERQIERLGFGDLYFVSQLGSRDCSAKVSPSVSPRAAA